MNVLGVLLNIPNTNLPKKLIQNFPNISGNMMAFQVFSNFLTMILLESRFSLNAVFQNWGVNIST